MLPKPFFVPLPSEVEHSLRHEMESRRRRIPSKSTLEVLFSWRGKAIDRKS